MDYQIPKFTEQEVIEPLRIDDYCPKCGQVTVHLLYAESIRDSGITECTECDNRERA